MRLKGYLEATGHIKKQITNKNMAGNKKNQDRPEWRSYLLGVNFDDRGYLYEIVHNYDIPKSARFISWGDPVRGLIRAFHKHDVLWDYFCIVKGSAKFVLSDDRKEGKTYKATGNGGYFRKIAQNDNRAAGGVPWLDVIWRITPSWYLPVQRFTTKKNPMSTVFCLTFRRRLGDKRKIKKIRRWKP